MRGSMAYKADKVVKAFAIWMATIIDVAREATLADETSRVPRSLENISNANVIRGLAQLVDTIPSDTGVAGVFSGEQGATAWCANGGAGVGTGELDAITRHCIKVWCPDIPLSCIAGVAVAEVIREDKNDVRFVESCTHLASDSILGAKWITRVPAVVFLSGRDVNQTDRLMEHL
jgi:hypothetical protein